MKHPHTTVLQDYFENELTIVQAGLVRDHLLNCDECSRVLSEMAKVDTASKRHAGLGASAAARERLFAEASALLRQRRTEHALRLAQEETRAEVSRRFIRHWQESWPDLRMPALQLASVSLVVAILIAANRDAEVSIHKPFPEGVFVGTHSDHNAPLIPGDNE